MGYGIPDLVTYELGTIFIVLLPGPNSLHMLLFDSQRGVGYMGVAVIKGLGVVLIEFGARSADSKLN